MPLRDLAADLLLGSTCVGCGRPGRLLCPGCLAGLSGRPRLLAPDPCPPGLAPSWSVLDYDGAVRAMITGHKEHRLLALGPVLGGLLARAVAGAVPADGWPLVLVAVPGRPATVRARGHDPARTLARCAARALRRAGYAATAYPLLRPHGRVADQVGLTAAERFANLDGTLRCDTRAVRTLRARHRAVRVVVCDDVLTTGATVREAQRALAAGGLPPAAIATIAATRRRPGPVTETRVPPCPPTD
jgi:predicted amidophosphoribosyltransferase